MVSKTLFKTKTKKKVAIAPVANTRNRAGGVAYDLGSEAGLAQYVCTGTFNGTFYASEDQHFKTVQALVDRVSPEFLAKAAVYGAEEGRMKDMPAYLLAVLAARGETKLLSKAFPRVIKNAKMLCNFVQIVRSGQTGRKSFGTAVKRLINEFLQTRKPDDLFRQHFGHSAPSVADIIKMTHPAPRGPIEEALYGYLIGRTVEERNLPRSVREFEAFKSDNSAPLPNLDYRALSNCKLTQGHWKHIARNMPWNMLRMNLNKLAREGVLNDGEVVDEIAEKLRDPDQVKKFNVFPYQLMTTFQNIDSSIPQSIRLALQDALDISVQNVPDFGDVAVLVDVSGSMQSAVTGNRGTTTSVTKCVDVAALIASCVLNKSPDAWIVQFDTSARRLNLNPRDSVMTNTRNVAANGGGTDVGCGLHYIRKQGCKAKTVIIVSDNESWYNGRQWSGYRSSKAADEWSKYSTKDVPGARLVCIDIQPSTTTQVPDNKNVLNIGGFSDSVFDVIASFIEGDGDHFVQTINNTAL